MESRFKRRNVKSRNKYSFIWRLPNVKDAVSTSRILFWTSLSSMWSLILLSGSPEMAFLHRRFHLVLNWSSTSIIIIMRGADRRTCNICLNLCVFHYYTKYDIHLVWYTASTASFNDFLPRAGSPILPGSFQSMSWGLLPIQAIPQQTPKGTHPAPL